MDSQNNKNSRTFVAEDRRPFRPPASDIPQGYTQDQIHNLRKEVDYVIQETNKLRNYHGRVNGMREVKLAYTKLQEAKMWLGKVLEEIGSELPAEYRDQAEKHE